MRIVDLDPAADDLVRQVAALLVEGFSDISPDAWPDFESALGEVRSSFGPDRISRVALEDDIVLGWIGGIAQYDGRVWELHPLVVRADRRRQGIGRALVADLEACVAARGALTLWVGTDDEAKQTSLGGVDLYPNVLERLLPIRNLRGHPFEFYQRCGFVIVGVMPDANGPGKPDLFLAKRVAGERGQRRAKDGRSLC